MPSSVTTRRQSMNIQPNAMPHATRDRRRTTPRPTAIPMLMLEAPETLPRNTGSLPAVFESLSRPFIPLHRSINAHSASSSEEHTSELQSLMRISYAVFCLKNHRHLHTAVDNAGAKPH